jgi:hypothetical protein
MIIMLKMNPAGNGGKLLGYPSAPRFAMCQSDIVCLLTRTNFSVPQPQSQDCWILIGHCLWERMSADVCPN